jgi:hypothetical protein
MRKYAQLSRPPDKDKTGVLNHQILAIFKFTTLIINELIEDTQLRNFRNNPKCAVRYDPFFPTSAVSFNDFNDIPFVPYFRPNWFNM